GRGVLSDRDPRGLTGRVATTELVPNADVILAIGTRFLLAANAGFGSTPVAGKLIHADIDPQEIGRNHPADVSLLGDARFTAGQLAERVQKHNRARASRTDEFARIKAAHWKAMETTLWQR